MLSLVVQQPCGLHLATIICFALILDTSSSIPWNLASFTGSCGHTAPPLWLCDPENILQDTYGNVTSALASVNNDTQGVIYWEEGQEIKSYYGYVIAAAVVDTVEPEENEGPTESAKRFGLAVQQTWFGDRICDNSSLVLVSLNTSQFFIFHGAGTETRLRTHHKQVCQDIQLDASNATEALVRCVADLDTTLADALQPMANAAWGYGGVVAIMAMLVFHYWIKY